jgi:hypothetical protein
MKYPINVETDENYLKYKQKKNLNFRVENVPKNLNFLNGSAY